MPGPGVTFASGLERHRDRAAVVTADFRISYSELAARADDFASGLGEVRRLVVIEGANRIEPLIAYLGALRAGHPVVLSAPDATNQPAFIEAYAPDFIY